MVIWMKMMKMMKNVEDYPHEQDNNNDDDVDEDNDDEGRQT